MGLSVRIDGSYHICRPTDSSVEVVNKGQCLACHLPNLGPLLSETPYFASEITVPYHSVDCCVGSIAL